MSVRVSKFVIVAIAIASFAVGIFASPAILGGALFSAGNQEQLSSELNEQIKTLSSEVDKLKTNAPEGAISELEKQIQSLDDKLDQMRALSAELERLKDEVEKLRGSPAPPTSQQLSGNLNKSEYNAGDSLTVTGSASPNSSVTVSILDSNNSVVSQGSITSDSSGRFTFTAQLSNSLASGNYKVRIIQGSDTVEKTFRLGSSSIITPGGTNEKSTQGFSVRTEKEYLRGESVEVSGITAPNTFVDFDVFDSNDAPITVTSTVSDSNGNYRRVIYDIPTSAGLGVYKIKATTKLPVPGSSSTETKELTINFSVVTSKSSPTPPPSSGALTIQTNKPDYLRGNFVQVTGKTASNTTVILKVEVPTGGDDLVLSDKADEAGNYSVLFQIKPDDPTGKWKITATQGTNTATVDIIVF